MYTYIYICITCIKPMSKLYKNNIKPVHTYIKPINTLFVPPPHPTPTLDPPPRAGPDTTVA